MYVLFVNQQNGSINEFYVDVSVACVVLEGTIGSQEGSNGAGTKTTERTMLV